MRYVCTICGYVYDEEVEGTPFAELPDTWTCPRCGAGKDAFEPERDQAAAPAKPAASAAAPAAADAPAATGHELEELPAGVLAAICSNLARGCEKQYHPEEQELFLELAQYFTTVADEAAADDVPAPNDDLDRIITLLDHDLTEGYPDLVSAAQAVSDRGTQRICVWGEKVTRALKSLAERYRRDGAKMLAGIKIWVCSVCGFTYVGERPPAICPVCKVPDWKFDEITGRAA